MKSAAYKPRCILILSSSFGQGHMATARALVAAAALHPELKLTIKIIDFSEEVSRLFNKSSKRIYEINSKHMPALYKLMYSSTDVNNLPIRLANQLTYPIRKQHLARLLASAKPDLIISNYSMWQYIALQSTKDNFPNVEFATLITDSITIHSSWVIPESDFYLVANEPTATSLHTLGVPNRNIITSGYPVHPSFAQEVDEAAIRTHFTLPAERSLVLFSAAALRSTYVQRVSKHLVTNHPDLHLVVVTGRDTELHDALQHKTLFNTPHITLIGWTDMMQQLIQISTVVITKAGGSTVMECIAACKPMIINKIIPGQEEGNAELVERYKLGQVVTKATEISIALDEVLQDYTAYQNRLAAHSQPNAAVNTLRYLVERMAKTSSKS